MSEAGERTAAVERRTKESDVRIEINLDGTGDYEVSTGIPFFDHMLASFARHGLFDLRLTAKGDLAVDAHHTVEDVGICLGQAIHRALGDRRGIVRYGAAFVPMDEALARAALDLSGRPYLSYEVALPPSKIGDFDPGLAIGFFRAVSDHAKMNLHVDLLRGTDGHHCLEAVFKAFGRALDQASGLDRRIEGVLSTKGTLEI
ncbi:MAG: imidazoleglycerol-phosphate dehydratase HisB [Candidatus Latescibacteria bacterium]|nr:imidazoleglycerol-phosphate dehydratase HisB [Candidatus Latescibacterota bacterium]